MTAELRFTEKYLSHFQLFEDILTEGIERKAFKRVDVHITSFAIVGIIHALYHQWLLTGESGKLAGTFSQLRDLVFDGLVNRRPPRAPQAVRPAARST